MSVRNAIYFLKLAAVELNNAEGQLALPSAALACAQSTQKQIIC